MKERIYKQALLTPADRTRRIIAEVARERQIGLRWMLSRSRIHEYVYGRHHAAFRLRTETTLSYPQIARRLGYDDHTSIIHAVHAHARRNGIDIPRYGV